MKSIYFLAYIIFILISETPAARAAWATEEMAPIVMESSKDKVYVKKDGSYELVNEHTISVRREDGIQLVNLYRMQYEPFLESRVVEEAYTLNGETKSPVNKEMIEDKPTSSNGHGLTNLNQITIPFSNLGVGSKIYVRIKINRKAGMVPHFFLRTRFGAHFFQKQDETEITSELPISAKQNGNNHLVEVKSSTAGPLYKVHIKLLAPVYRGNTDEAFPAIRADTIPEVEVSSLSDWGPITNIMGGKIEAAFAEPLPPAFETILQQAKGKLNNKDKVHYVISELIRQVKYLGDWRNEKGYYLPRTLKEIADTKQGDCKDYSFATAAILRRLGLNAYISWVQRGASSELAARLSGSLAAFDPLLPGMDHFNHAIVYLQMDGKEYWLDPTNPIAHIGLPFEDIANRSALVVHPAENKLRRIPEADPFGSKIKLTKYYSFDPIGQAAVMAGVKLSGSTALNFQRQISSLTETEKQNASFQFLAPKSNYTFFGNMKNIDPESFPSSKGDTIEDIYVYQSIDLMQNTNLGKALRLPNPKITDRFLVNPFGRATGLSLGGKGTLEEETYFVNFSMANFRPQPCQVQSKWVSIKRDIEAKNSGLVIKDRFETFVDEIPVVDLVSEGFRQFQTQLNGCFADSLLIFQYAGPEKLGLSIEPIFNPLIPRPEGLKTRLDNIVQAIEKENPSDFVYLKLLGGELALRSPREAIAYGVMALSASNLNTASKETEAERYELEMKRLADFALQIDPNEFYANIVSCEIDRANGNFGPATYKANLLKEKYPHRWSPVKLGIDIDTDFRNRSRPAKAWTKAVAEAESAANRLTGQAKEAAQRFLTVAYQVVRKDEMAEKLHLELVRTHPKSVRTMLNYAGFLFARKRYDEAITYAKKSLTLEKTLIGQVILADAMAMKAEALQMAAAGSDIPTKSVSLCTEALELDSANRTCITLIGAHHIQTGTKEGNTALIEKGKALVRSAQSQGFVDPDRERALASEGVSTYRNTAEENQ